MLHNSYSDLIITAMIIVAIVDYDHNRDESHIGQGLGPGCQIACVQISTLFSLSLRSLQRLNESVHVEFFKQCLAHNRLCHYSHLIDVFYIGDSMCLHCALYNLYNILHITAHIFCNILHIILQFTIIITIAYNLFIIRII